MPSVRSERGADCVSYAKVRNRRLQVNDRLRGEAGHGGRSNVLDVPPYPGREQLLRLFTMVCARFGPGGVIVNDLHLLGCPRRPFTGFLRVGVGHEPQPPDLRAAGNAVPASTATVEWRRWVAYIADDIPDHRSQLIR